MFVFRGAFARLFSRASSKVAILGARKRPNKAFAWASIAALAASSVQAYGQQGALAPATSSSPAAKISYSQVPLAFESTTSVGASPHSFSARGSNFRFTLHPQEAVLESLAPSSATATPVHLRMVGANPDALPSGVDQLPRLTFQFSGSNPANWQTKANFARVRYRDIYPGVDLVYYGNQNQLEYDFRLAPHANPDQIQVAVAGAQQLRLGTNHDLILATSAGEISLGKPEIYQEVNGVRRAISGNFQLQGDRVGFTVGSYNPDLPLVIDPTLTYSTSLGRSINDKVKAIAVGSDGSTYIAGIAPALTAADYDQAFVAHTSADGKTLLYMTYLGGTGASDARGIAIDAGGNVYITGETKAPDFPVLNALQVTCSLNSSQQCNGDAFVAKINPTGALQFATYLGGSEEDAANAIAVDATGSIYVAGSTASLNFPVAHGPQFASGGNGDAFIAKLSSDGTQLVYSTYLGGTGADQALAITVDTSSNVYVTGQTESIDFPVKAALQAQCHVSPSNQCQGEAFLAKLSADGSQIAYSTYFGGSGVDSANAIALDSNGSVFIAGSTSSTDFPVAKPLQAKLNGKTAAFVAKFLPDASAVVYATFLGGSASDAANSIAIDKSGKVFISGQTNSPDFPTQGPVQAQCRKSGTGACSQDAFLAVLNATGTGLQFSTYLGGSGTDIGSGIAVDAKGSAYLGGATTTSDFPMVEAATMSSGLTPMSAKPFGSATALAAVAPSVPTGGIVAKIAGISPDIACSGSTINWTGSAGNNQWTTAANWSTNVLPIATDSVCISSSFTGSTITIGTISSATNQTVANLMSNANISFTAGPLTVTGGAQFAGSLSMTGGTLILNGTNGSSVAGTMSLTNSILAGTDTVSIGGLLTWGNNGEMCTVAACNTAGSGITNANGGINYSPIGNIFLYGRTLNNNGVATLGTTAGYNLYLNYSAVINNTASGTWNYTSDYPAITAGGTFNNAGTFEKTGGTGTTSVNAAFNNTHSVVGQTGTLAFASLTGTSSGSWNVSNGAALVLDGGTPSPSLSGNITGAGTVYFSAGTVDIIAGATFTGTGGALGINGGTVVFETGSAVTIAQAVALNSNGILAGTDAVSINGLLTWGNNGEMCTVAACNAVGSGITNANGGINYSPIGNIFLYGRTLNNNGVATLGTTAGYNLYLNYSAVINNTSSGTWNYTSDYPVITTGGTFNNAGTFEKTGGTGTTSVNAAFNNTHSVLGQTGTLTFSNLTGTSSGSWNVSNGAALVLDGGTPSPSLSGNITGAGTVYFSTGTVNIVAGATFTGTGALAINGGAVVFETGSAVTIAQAVSLNSNGILAGTDAVTINGLLTWGNNGEMCTVAACNAAGSGITNANGGINYSPIGNIFLYGRTLNNNGVATLGTTAGYNLYLNYSAVINNTSSGTWNYTSDYPVITTGGTFNNAGTFEKTGGTGTTSVNAAFNNTGSVLGQTGTVTFSSLTGTSTGSWSPSSGAALVLDGGTPIPSLSGTITGAGTVYFSAGTVDIIAGARFTGTGGALAINGGTVLFQTGSAVTIAQAVSLNSNGILAGTDAVTINGLLTWGNNGEMCTVAACNAAGSGITNANGGINYSPIGNIFLYGRTLNNNGVATLGTTAGYNLYLNYSAVINNTSSGTWNYTSDYPVITTGGTFNNAGTFEKTGGTGTTSVNAAFNNTGSVVGQTGTVTFSSLTGTSTGSWSPSSGAALVLDGGTPIPSLSGNITGAGTVYFSAGTVDIIAGARFTGTGGALAINGGTVLFQTGSAVTIAQAVSLNSNGILAGTDAVTINGLLTWGNNGEMCTVAACNAAGSGITNANGGINYSPIGNIFLYGRTLNNNGVATLGTTAGYNLYLNYSAVINNTSSGTWNYTSDYPVITTGGTFNNAGTFEKTGGTGTTSVATYNQTAGTTFIGTGSLAFGSTPTIQGGTITGSGAILGNYAGSVSTNPGGAIAPGTATADGAISLSGTGSGNYTTGTGSLNIKIGGTAAGQFDTLTATGTANLTGGSLNVTIFNGYTPSSTDKFTILTAAAVSGRFTITNIPAGWTVTYNATTVVLNASASTTTGVGLSPASLTFPSTIVGRSSAVLTVSVLNTGTAALTITSILSSDTTNYSYSADATKPCPISPATLAAGANCLLDVTFTPAAAGLHSAHITLTDNNNGTAGSTQMVPLTGTGIVLSSIAVTPVSASVIAGQTLQFTATGTYSDGSTANITSTVTWTSGTPSVATITGGGLATGVASGTSNITASLSGITSPAAVLTVAPKTLQSIAVTPATATIAAGHTQQFTATGTYSDGSTANITSTVTWTSSATSVGTIVSGGLATGVSAGTSNITASLSGITSPAAVLTVTVKTLQSIAITPASASIAIGQTQQFTATGTYSDGSTGNITSTVTWTSSATSVGTITSSGLATGVAVGSANITASLTGITSPAAVLTVTTKILQSIAVTPATASVAAGHTQQFTAIGTYSDGSTGNITSTVTWTSSATSVGTITSSGLATGVALGSTNITASLTGITSPSAVLTVTTKVLQSIAVTPLSVSIAAGQTQQFTATGTYSDGSTGNLTSTVTWTSGTTSVGTITSSGLATGVAVGTTNITASLTGVTSPVAILTVTSKTLQSIAVTPATASVAVGQTQQFTATGTYSDGSTGNITSTVTWTSSATSVGTITSGGLATGVAIGTSNITATLGSITSPSAVLTVTTKILRSIAVTPAAASINVGQTQQFTATGTYSDGSTGNITSNVTWTSTTTSVGTITSSGLATGVAVGTTNITASLTGITSPSAALTVTTKVLQSIAVTPSSASIAAGHTQQFTATGTYSDGSTGNITSTVTWVSATTSVGTITSSGLATGVAVGSTNITATLTGITSPVAVLTVTTKTLQSIAVTPASASVAIGQTQQFTATGTYSDGSTGNISSTVTWISATTSVGTITSSGLATGVAVGSTNITATLTGITSPVAVLTVTTKTLQSIAVTPASASVAIGQTQQFTATGTYSDGSTGVITSTVTWVSATTSVGTITSSGLATGIAVGSTNITASLTGISSPAAVLTVTTKTLQSIAVTPASASIAIGQTQQFTATGTYSDGSTGNVTSTVTWISATTSVGTITSSGLATGVAVGSTNITATLTGITSPVAVLTVTTKTLQSIAVTPASASVATGQTQQFTATATYSDGSTANITSTVTWTSSATSVGTITSSGLATGVAVGSTNITASLTGITSPAAVLTVTTKILRSIAVTPASASVAIGQTQQFTATGTYSDGSTGNVTSTVTWISATTSVGTITSSGLATGVAIGTTNITATLGSITSPSAVLTVTTKILQSIAVTPTAASINVGQTQQFTATGTYSDGSTGNVTSTVTWISATTSVGTITSSGLATGVAIGTTNITATLGGITSPSAVLTVTTKILQSIAVTPAAASINAGQTQQFTATGTYSDGSTGNITSTVTWSSSNTAAGTIAAGGLATGVAAGSTNITASLSGITSPAAILTVTPAPGEPQINITLLDQSAPGSSFYVDILVTNTGAGPANNISLSQVNFRTLAGTGTVTYVSPALPIAIGALNPSSSATIRLYLNVPASVTRFTLAEGGSVQDSHGSTFSYASSQVVAY